MKFPEWYCGRILSHVIFALEKKNKLSAFND
jgi:hypothetical protein